ncbi:hypothetical protein PAMP_019454 [Pampus punctatissimus]
MAGLVSSVGLVVMLKALMHAHGQHAVFLEMMVLVTMIAADSPVAVAGKFNPASSSQAGSQLQINGQKLSKAKHWVRLHTPGLQPDQKHLLESSLLLAMPVDRLACPSIILLWTKNLRVACAAKIDAEYRRVLSDTVLWASLITSLFAFLSFEENEDCIK